MENRRYTYSTDYINLIDVLYVCLAYTVILVVTV